VGWIKEIHASPGNVIKLRKILLHRSKSFVEKALILFLECRRYSTLGFNTYGVDLISLPFYKASTSTRLL